MLPLQQVLELLEEFGMLPNMDLEKPILIHASLKMVKTILLDVPLFLLLIEEFYKTKVVNLEPLKVSSKFLLI